MKVAIASLAFFALLICGMVYIVWLEKNSDEKDEKNRNKNLYE